MVKVMSISFRNISIDPEGKHPVAHISGYGFAAWPELNIFLKRESFSFPFHLHYPTLLQLT